jgi:hypothetical protein
MPRFDDRLTRGLVFVAGCCTLAAVAAAITGGFSIQLGSVTLRSHDPVRPMIAASVLLLIALAGGAPTVAAALEWHWRVLERRAAAAALSLAAIAVLAGFHWGAFVAGGSDSYCYLNQAELLARGQVHDHEPLSEDTTFPGTSWSFAPAGHIPMGSPVPALVPICPAGYPLIMAGARRAVGRNAMFWITPLMGGLTVYLAFLLGRRLAGPAAGVLTATLTLTSPTFLIQLFQPMNDVTAAAAWCAILMAALQDGWSDRSRAACAGLLTAAALTIRPNLLPLAVVAGLGLAILPTGRSLSQRAAMVVVFAIAALPGVAVVMASQNAMYGSPLKSGYGDLGTMFAAAHVAPNLQRYARWLIEAHTPAIAAALAAPWLLSSRGPHRLAVWLLAFAAATLACYLPYVVFDAWWYTRFLLPAIPPLLALAAAVAVVSIDRLRAPARPVAFALLAGTLAAISIRTAVTHDVFRIRDLEWRFRSVGERAASLPENAAFITLHHSGSLRFYAGRPTVGWADIDQGRLDDAIAFLRRHGRKPYLLFEKWEEPQFRARFAGDRLGALGWPPMLEVDGVRTYDPDDYDRHLRGERIVTERVESKR